MAFKGGVIGDVMETVRGLLGGGLRLVLGVPIKRDASLEWLF